MDNLGPSRLAAKAGLGRALDLSTITAPFTTSSDPQGRAIARALLP